MEKKLNKHISRVVSHLMKTSGPKPLSQGKLAKISGVSQALLCITLNDRGGWSIDILERLCPALGITVGELIRAAETYDPQSPGALAGTLNNHFKIGDKVVQRRDLADLITHRGDCPIYKVHGLYETAEGLKYHILPLVEDLVYQEDWAFRAGHELVPEPAAREVYNAVKDKIGN